MEAINNISAILRSEELINYSKKSTEDFAKFIFLKDFEAGKNFVVGTASFLIGMPNLIFCDKFKRFCNGTFKEFDEQVKMAKRFDSDKGDYNVFVKRQILLLNEMEDDRKIDWYANLTRACLLEQIDVPLYFKLATILKSCTPDELIYLEKNINRPILKLNIFIESFINNSLAKRSLASIVGNDEYCYTEMAEYLINFGIRFGDESYCQPKKMIKLEDVSVVETRTLSGLVKEENDSISLDPTKIK